MSRQIANPLASIVAAARRSLPQTTGATAAAQADRDRPRRHVILADVSASMAEPAGLRTKRDVLGDALRHASAASTIVAFGGVVAVLAPGAPLPVPSGGTPLHVALAEAGRLGATDLLVISDGHPDSAERALVEADRLRARIDVVYCGPEHDHVGLAFMGRLARGGGAAHHRSMSDAPRMIETTRQLLLAAPTGRPS